MRSRLAVTGTGAVTSAGATIAELWDGMLAGRPMAEQVKDPWANMPVPLLYTVATEHAVADGAAGRTGAMALRAAREALVRSTGGGLPAAPHRVGVVVGSAMGESGEHERRRAGADFQPAGAEPLFSVAAAVADGIGSRGPAVSVSNACAASVYALGLAIDMISGGECDAVVVLGAESYSRVALACFNRMGAVDPQGCRPFAADRGGTVFGEGAAALVIEPIERAAERGAPLLAEILGFGWSCDAGHPTAPDPTGGPAERALRAALAEAAMPADGIGAVVPHGTGTELNDAVEADLLRRVLGGRTGQVPVYSLKALLGHTGGAAGALAAVAAVEITNRGAIPANVDVGPIDPACSLFLDHGGRDDVRGAVLVNAYAFGGNNASVVFGRPS